MYSMGHSEVAESLSTMAATLGKEMLTSEDGNDWDPGMFVITNLDRHTLSSHLRSHSKMSHDFRKQR